MSNKATQCYDPGTWLGTPHVMSTNHVTLGVRSISDDIERSPLGGNEQRATHSLYYIEHDVSLMETSCKFFVHTAINLIVPIPQVASISLDTYLLFNNSLNPRDCHPVTPRY